MSNFYSVVTTNGDIIVGKLSEKESEYSENGFIRLESCLRLDRKFNQYFPVNNVSVEDIDLNLRLVVSLDPVSEESLVEYKEALKSVKGGETKWH